MYLIVALFLFLLLPLPPPAVLSGAPEPQHEQQQRQQHQTHAQGQHDALQDARGAARGCGGKSHMLSRLQRTEMERAVGKGGNRGAHRCRWIG